MVRPDPVLPTKQIDLGTKSHVPKALNALAITFYPGVQEIDEASTLSVLAGENAEGRVVIASSPAHIVFFELPVNTPASSVSLAAESQNFDLTLRISVVRDTKTGKYIAENLPEGRYIVKGDWFANGSDHHGIAHLSLNASTQKTQYIEEEFPVSVSGLVHHEDSTSRDLPSTLLLESQAGGIYSKHYEAKIGAQGNFDFPIVEPGKYVISVTGGQPSYIASISENSKSVMGDSIVIPNKQGKLSLNVEIKHNTASLSGIVSESDKPVGGVGVLVQAMESGAVSILKTNESGLFRVVGLAAGEYQLSAWQNLENLPYRSPSFLKKLAHKAEIVSLDAGQQSSLIYIREAERN